MEKGEPNGEAVEAVAGDVKEAGRAGTEGGVVVEVVGVLVDAETVGTVERDEGEATAAIEPLRSHGFGGEPIGGQCMCGPIRYNVLHRDGSK